MTHFNSKQTACFLLCVLTVVFGGCHRSYYREQADAEAYALIYEKANDCRWQMPDPSIMVDEQSRMFDPFSQDCPPMPPDDPASNEFMHYVAGQRAWDGWENNGVLDQVENPNWRAMLPLNADNRLELNMDSSVQMALINAPEYQNELEDLYLSALDVSLQRFQFDIQYFGEVRQFLDASNSASSYGISTNHRKSRMLATGATLAAGLANSLIWEFSGSDSHAASTLFDFAILQPLLRGGGRDYVLEALTQTERDLLANVRQMERFRRAFYVEVATGRGASGGPNRGGPVFTAFTNTGGGAGGYLGLVQTQQDIRNQRSTIASLQSSVAQLEAFFRAGRIDFFQAEFARQALFSAQSRLLNTERNLQSSLDNFKITLGLPPDIELEVDDELIAPFQLVDPEIIPLQNGLTLLQQQAGQTMSRIFVNATEPALEKAERSSRSANDDNGAMANDGNETAPDDDLLANQEVATEDVAGGAAPADDPMDPPTLEWTPAIAQELQKLADQLDGTIDLITEARETHLDVARNDAEQLKTALNKRTRITKLLKQQIRKRLERTGRQSGKIEITDADIAAILPDDSKDLKELPGELSKSITVVRRELDASEQRLNRLIERIQTMITSGASLEPEALYAELQSELRTTIPDELNEVAATVLSLTLIEARARTESATLPTVKIGWSQAVAQARENRLDWMNARAGLVDSWRNIQFTARDLEGQLDVSLSGELGKVTGSEFRRNLRFEVEFDAPLTRLAERNTYRQSLIDYQRARREYYRFEDGVTVSLRDIIRRLEINQINFELQRAAVKVAISQVELARLRLQEPPKPNEASTLGATTARDLVSALQGLLGAQNDFLNVWVSQEALRRFLDLDMGTMQLDANGIWIDPGPQLGNGSSDEEFDVLATDPDEELNFEAPPEMAPPAERIPADELPQPILDAVEPEVGIIEQPLILPLRGRSARKSMPVAPAPPTLTKKRPSRPTPKLAPVITTPVVTRPVATVPAPPPTPRPSPPPRRLQPTPVVINLPAPPPVHQPPTHQPVLFEIRVDEKNPLRSIERTEYRQPLSPPYRLRSTSQQRSVGSAATVTLKTE